VHKAATCWRERTSKQRQQRRLARAIRPDKRNRVASPHVEVNVDQRDSRTEGATDALSFKQWTG
jgi:hypothetical protein